VVKKSLNTLQSAEVLVLCFLPAVPFELFLLYSNSITAAFHPFEAVRIFAAMQIPLLGFDNGVHLKRISKSQNYPLLHGVLATTSLERVLWLEATIGALPQNIMQTNPRTSSLER
jgi:hypothetical protein